MGRAFYNPSNTALDNVVFSIRNTVLNRQQNGLMIPRASA
jgi:hypothetical protein